MPAARNYVPPPPDQNIMDIEYRIFSTICQFQNIDLQWRRLVEKADDSRVFKLSAFDVENLASVIHRSMNASPAMELLKKWSSLGMTVEVLARMLRELGDEASLVYLIPREMLTVITQPPEQLELVEGEPLEISCMATGFPRPNYIWFRGQTKVSDKQDGRLRIESVRMEDAGVYTCRIHHSYHGDMDYAFSGKCRVTIKPSPFPRLPPRISPAQGGLLHIKEHPQSVTVQRGQSFMLKCVAVGEEPIYYYWQKNGELLPEHKGSCVTISQATDLSTGAYRCIVKNRLQEVKSDVAQVTLRGSAQGSSRQEGLPVIVSHPPASQTCCHDGRVLLSIKVNSRIPYTIQWYHNGRPIPGQTKSDCIIEMKGREVSGMYQAAVTVDGSPPILSHQSKVIYDSLPPSAYFAYDKVALVIGTGMYRSYGSALPAVQNDLRQTINLLREMDFHVVSLIDLTLQEMKDAVEHFCDLVAAGVYVVFYCAGHGYQDEARRHYLVPWDTQEGLRHDECLCIDDVETQIQQKSPALLLLFLDMCRKSVRHLTSQTEPRPVVTGPIRPNRAIFYASSSGQQAYEEKEGRTADISRGIFNRYFVDSMQLHDLKVGDLFACLQEKFRSCPYDRERFPQDPEITMNINELGRSLWDPIDPEKKAELKKNRVHNWDRFLVVPNMKRIPIGQIGGIALSFGSIINNVLNMTVHKSFLPNYRVEVDIPLNEVDSIVKPVFKSHSDPSANAVAFQFSNIHRLRNHLRIPISLTIRAMGMDGQEHEQHCTFGPFDLGLPLIAPLCLGSGATRVPRQETRQAVEHSDSECSLPDLSTEKSLK